MQFTIKIFTLFVLAMLTACSATNSVRPRLVDLDFQKTEEALPELYTTHLPVSVMETNNKVNAIKLLTDKTQVIIGSVKFVSKTKNLNILKQKGKQVGAQSVVVSIAEVSEKEKIVFLHDATFLAISREKRLEYFANEKKRAAAEDARPKLISAYKEKGYRFSDSMTFEEAIKHHENLIDERLEESMKHSSMTIEMADSIRERGRENIKKSWENYKKKMEPGDMISFLFASHKSPIEGGMGVGWDGYVIIRDKYFLHSLTNTVYN